MSRASAALVAAFVSALELSPTQERPVFRAGVEIVATDVVVLTKDGKPVRDLGNEDFVITAGGKPRAVKSVTFVEGRPGSATTTQVQLRSTGVPGPTVNSREADGRTIVFVVDVENIRAGEGRGGVQAIGDYLDQLNPNDYVGLVALPYGTPRVDLTTNRALIREAASRVTGSSNADRTGEIEGKVWERPEELARTVDCDGVVKVRGTVEIYNEKPQLVISRMRNCQPDEYDPRDFCPASQRDPEEMYERLLTYVGMVVISVI